MRYFILALLVLSNSAFSAPNPSCKTLQQDLNELFQELLYQKGLACIYTSKDSNDQVTISFFEKAKDGFKKIAENNTFISLEDMQMYQPLIDEISDNHFQLAQYFPRDTYLVELQSIDNMIKITTINKTITLNSTIDNQPPLSVTFSINNKKLKSISFDLLNQEQAFNVDNLELAQSSHGKEIPITADKAPLFSGPNPNQISKAYLIKNDKVILLDGLGKWLKIRYTNKSNVSAP